MKTYLSISRLLALALALVSLTLPAARAATFQVPIAATGGSVTTGSVTVLTPLILSGTEIQLPLGLSNLKTNVPMTNNWNSWVIYGSPTVSNSMFAVNRGLGIVTNSTSFSGLMQSIVNRGVEGFHIEIMPNPYYSNSYSADSTITITNWGIIQGHGNPVTVIRGTAALNGPIFQVGTTNGGVGGVPIGSGGINRFKDLRLEGDNAGANGVGVKIVNSAEPTFRDMEVTGFKKAGIELASTNDIFWAYADHVWFVMENANAVGLLVSGSSIATDRAANHFDVNDCNFGVGGGGEPINITADFPNIRVTDSIFKYASGTMSYGINQLNGRDAYYSGNKFVNFQATTPITFAASGGLYTGVTNLNPTFVNNHSDGTGEIITLGQFVTNVTMLGNSIRGSGPTVLYEDVTSNGRISNFDPTDMRVGTDAAFSGHVTVTSNITAQSFIGSGTGVPILKLQTMMSADNAFAITVATNWMQSTTNSFVFTNVTAGQVISALSSSAGQVVWTNTTPSAGGGASVTFSAVPTALNSVSNYAKQLMFQSMKPNASTSLDRQSAESPNTQGGVEVPPVNASLPIGLSATNHTGLYGWFPSTDLFHYSTRDHASTFLVSFVGQTSSNRTWIGLSGAAAVYNTDVPGTPTYGFRHSSVVADNNWVCYSADGTRTVSNLVTTGSITTNVLYALATVKTGTNVIFYIDGAPKFTNHFDPAGAIMSYRIIGSKAGATGARSGIILHDYFSTTTIP